MVGDEDDVQRRRFRPEDVSREFGLTRDLSWSFRRAGLDLTSCDAPANTAQLGGTSVGFLIDWNSKCGRPVRPFEPM